MINKEQARMFTDVVLKVIATFPDAEVSIMRGLRFSGCEEDAPQCKDDVIFTARLMREGILHMARVSYSEFISSRVISHGPNLAQDLITGLQREIFERVGVAADSNTVPALPEDKIGQQRG